MKGTMLNRLVQRRARARQDAPYDDEGLAVRVWEQLERFDPFRIEVNTIGIECQNGRVLLTGWVGSPIQRSLLARVAGRTPGVRAIDNRLLVPREVEGEIFAALLCRLGLETLARANAQVKVAAGRARLVGDFEDWRTGELARALVAETFRRLLAETAGAYPPARRAGANNILR